MDVQTLIQDLVDSEGTPDGAEKVYVGWNEVVGIKYHGEAAHPYIELVLEKDDGTTSRNH